MLPEIYQTVLINFGNTIYSGYSFDDAKQAADKAGFEAAIQLDGALVAWFSPISGWRFY